MRDRLSREYQVQEFAKLAGVSFKALHHYDRVELLKPRRTDALQLKRAELQHRHRLIDREISAIGDAKRVIERGIAIDSLALQKIIAVIGMQNSADSYSRRRPAKPSGKRARDPLDQAEERRIRR